MNVLTLMGVFCALWILATLWLAPLIRRTWEDGNLAKKVGRAGVLAVVDKLRDLSAAGAATLLCVALVLSVASYLGQSAVAIPSILIKSLTGLYWMVSGIATEYAVLFLSTGVIGIVVGLLVFWRAAKARVTRVWTQRAEQLFHSLIEEPEIMDRWQSRDRVLRKRLELLHQLLQNPSSGEDAKAQTAILLREIALLRSMEELREEGTFETPSNSTTKPMAASGIWGTIVQAIASPRLSRDLGLINRWASTGLTALLVISLLGWSSPPLADSLRLAVNNLRVHAAHADVQRVMDGLVSPEQPEPPESQPPAAIAEEELDHLVRTLTRATVRELANSKTVARSVNVSWPRSASSEFVRAQILQRSMGDGSSTEQISGIRREVAATAVQGTLGAEDDNLLQRVRSQVEPIADQLHAESPSATRRLLDVLAARYGDRPRHPIDVQSSLVGRLVANSLGALDLGDGAELDKLAAALAMDMGKAAIETWVATQAKAIVIDALEADARPAVVRQLADSFSFEASAGTKSLMQELADATETGWRPADWEESSAWKSDLVADALDSATEPSASSIPSYSQLFPNTTEVRLANGSSRVIGASLAKSFTRASRSWNTRGVLIGREIEYAGPNLSNLEWQEVDREPGTSIELSVEDGEERFAIGTFPAGIVNQALRYAADGRVVAVTMVDAPSDVLNLVTNLHPALEDTTLGCRILEADRIIDGNTLGPAPWLEESSEESLDAIRQHRKAAYDYLYATRIAEFLAATRCDADDRSQLDELLPSATLESAAFRTGTSEFLDQLDPSLASKDLLEDTFDCLTGERARMVDCMCSSAGRYNLTRPYWFPEDHTSQVRERDISGSDARDLLTASGEPDEFLKLWLHTTFAVRENGESSDESTATAMDFPRDQIDLLNAVMFRDGIEAYLRSASVAQRFDDFMRPVQQFVFLQRFFRIALNGAFGQGFDIHRLIELERDTAHFVATQVTLKWQPSSVNAFENRVGERTLSFLHRSDYTSRGEQEDVCGPPSR